MSIERIATRIRRRVDQGGEDGFSLVEVVVAMMVFALLMIGMSYSLVTMQRLSKDSTLRQTAIGLAKAELDRLNQKANPLDLTSSSSSVTGSNGTVYTIDRTVQWVPASGTIAACGTGGGNLLYKNVSIQVTWPGMTTITKPVQLDTNISPSDRVNDPSMGTVVVAVLGADGLARQGVTVTITNKATGVALANVPATDIDGCSYVLKVPPANYSIKINKTGFITSTTMTLSSTTGPAIDRTVEAGATASAKLDFDAAMTLNRAYASDKPSGNVVMPSNLDTSYFYSGGVYSATDSGVLSSSNTTAVKLFPYPDGYTVAAGKVQAATETTASCLSPDPQAWSGGAVNGQNKGDGARPASASADPGGSASVAIPMGYVKVNNPSTVTKIVATSASSNYPGDPGCLNPMSYSFSVSGGSSVLALPYGTWKLTGYTASLIQTALSNLTLPTGLGAVAAGQTITLDPRPNQ
ncbi:type IV pilus modification PilV family protein [Schumannella soli]|uniref:Prepilin-type N-terminal cleavage/methylation domain-containing protein n=1 Tax=Schumannella soli TaxID=2590779 RepID=A0A506XZF9_9MICO|nr:prepilin-type N-terminal cleavage/methylation domain-containing protein [Schumannella soli]TPW74780.1 prepilin-type N-terminal cleavage/methylation domain-containing protein [Schumannella soli]